MSPLPTRGHATILPVFIAMVAGWLPRHQQQVITYLIEENRVLKAHLGGRRLQCARQLTDPYDGFLLGKRYLIHDRDTTFTRMFDGLLKSNGGELVVLPPRSPNLNVFCERFVRSIKEEALEQMVMLGERSLYDAIQPYLGHYHTERNHQGLANQLITPEPDLGSHSGQVRRRGRLGRLLSYDQREAA